MFYYESRKRELKTKLIYENRWDERLKNESWGIYTPRIHWVTPFLLSSIHRYISFGEVSRICRTVSREPMDLCTSVIEEGGDGEATCSETPSLLSYILRYVSFTEVGRICRAVLREPMQNSCCLLWVDKARAKDKLRLFIMNRKSES